MAGPLDLTMAAALRLLRIPFIVLVHDADAHPGDAFPMQMWLQRQLCRRAAAVAALSTHVSESVIRQKLAGTTKRPLIRLKHPPMPYEVPPRQPRGNDGFRLLSFGRLLPYKGLDLLAESLRRLGPVPGLMVRVVGSGPESHALAMLRAMPWVTVENCWVPEDEVGALLGWADAVVLPYREASQSGVAAVALAAGRRVVATNVGGLTEQLVNEPLALLCEPDPDSLTDGLRRMLHRPPDIGEASGNLGAGPQGAWQELGRTLVDQLCALLRHRKTRGTGGRFAAKCLG
jgi:glycosyltransferase involved in cell wall biosynthesis